MVVFTCAHCGESVKKNQVEKHYSITRCRNAFPTLTCVDCLKDFNGDEYNVHTSCITEEERYSAKGFVSKPPSIKGKNKQESWINFVRNILDSDINMGGHVKYILKGIANDPGIPQKKPRFLNFCKCKFRSYNITVYEEVFEFLQKKRLEFQNGISAEANNQTNEESDQEDRKRKRIDSNNECSTENGVGDESKPTPDHSGKKKKQEKEDKFGELLKDVGEDANMETGSKKKKKKKLSFQNSTVHENEQENCDERTVVGEVISEGVKESEVYNLLSKKGKKEKRKKEKYEKQLLEIQNEPVHGDGMEQVNNNVEASQKNKKEKKKHRENGAIEEIESTVKTASKKNQRQPDIENGENVGEEGKEVLNAKPTKFNWEETVVKLLESKGELPLKRVEKKVVNEYINSGVYVDSVEKVVAKFNKKILKMSSVKVKKDIVKLVS